MSGGWGRNYGPQGPLLPVGWLDCPNWGGPIVVTDAQGNRPAKYLNVIPCKVPLTGFGVPPNKTWDLRSALRILQQQGYPIGMVVDLTNSFRYYKFDEEVPDSRTRNITYVKVRCRGRGESPEPAAVNDVLWNVWCFIQNDPQRYILMHCTHGFNRTGYMIVCLLVRLFGDQGMNVERGLRRFARAREPGIYKDGYINDLYRYFHEKRDMNKSITPRVPAWKGVDRDDDEAEEGENHAGPLAQPNGGTTKLNHERIYEIGEPVTPQEAEHVQHEICYMVLNKQPHQIRFPGSQPVSLARSNMDLIRMHRYWVTWKADGTRYMLWITQRGSYLVDRSFNVAHVQMRFPTRIPREKLGKGAPYPVGAPLAETLLDGEMVIDTDKAPDGTVRYFRRYLIYDVMAVNNVKLVDKPWIDRYQAVDEVVKSREREKEYIRDLRIKDLPGIKFTSPPLRYLYEGEPFSVRRKNFWPLGFARKLIDNFIPKLCHESDGLILQPHDDPYKPHTCEELLKWKFAHLNSVDFKLECPIVGVRPVVNDPSTDCKLYVMKGGRRGGPPDLSLVPDARVFFPEDLLPPEGPAALHGMIIECAWDKATKQWRYMRVREDKNTPNAIHVYHKVVASIDDNIEGPELLQFLEASFWQDMQYAGDHELSRKHHADKPEALQQLVPVQAHAPRAAHVHAPAADGAEAGWHDARPAAPQGPAIDTDGAGILSPEYEMLEYLSDSDAEAGEARANVVQAAVARLMARKDRQATWMGAFGQPPGPPGEHPPDHAVHNHEDSGAGLGPGSNGSKRQRTGDHTAAGGAPNGAGHARTLEEEMGLDPHYTVEEHPPGGAQGQGEVDAWNGGDEDFHDPDAPDAEEGGDGYRVTGVATDDHDA